MVFIHLETEILVQSEVAFPVNTADNGLLILLQFHSTMMPFLWFKSSAQIALKSRNSRAPIPIETKPGPILSLELRSLRLLSALPDEKLKTSGSPVSVGAERIDEDRDLFLRQLFEIITVRFIDFIADIVIPSCQDIERERRRCRLHSRLRMSSRTRRELQTQKVVIDDTDHRTGLSHDLLKCDQPLLGI
jgi:hypothetical protein